MAPTLQDIVGHLLGALAAGGAIGLERSYHGRPAGFRTHALVCLSSSLLMVLTLSQARWFQGPADVVRIDPTRMAQGIMTGIGFLGAGVIFKEGITVRGLTTAASIWITSAIGILMGVGLYAAAAVATVLTLGVLAAFRYIERVLPTYRYANHRVRFDRDRVMAERDLRGLLRETGFSVSSLSYTLGDEGRSLEYGMTIRTVDERNFARLAAALAGNATVRAFHIAPSGD
jgi:putative Mg2+ transporter-C (MgtC) family protein